MLAHNNGRRILVVDDEAVVRQTLERALGRDFEVRSLESGARLPEVLQEFDPGLVIMDVRLPQVNGLELCSKLREDSRYNDVALMFLSAVGDLHAIYDGFAGGGDYYMTKPFDIPTLMRIVKALVSRKHSAWADVSDAPSEL